MTTGSFPFHRNAGLDETALAAALRACARRDPAALHEVLDDSSPRLLALLLQVLGDARQAEQALVECGERIWRESPGYLPTLCPPGLWLCSIARRVGTDMQRQRAAPPSAEELQVLLQQAEVEPVPRDTAARPLVDSLDPLVRRGLRLSYLSAATPATLAPVLGLPERVLRRQLQSALATIGGLRSGAPAGIPDLLAGAYVLGMQTAAVRRRFAERLRRQPELRRSCLWWEVQLAALVGEPLPARPSVDPWPAVAARIEGPARMRLRAMPRRWLWLSALVVAAAVALVWKAAG